MRIGVVAQARKPGSNKTARPMTRTFRDLVMPLVRSRTDRRRTHSARRGCEEPLCQFEQSKMVAVACPLSAICCRVLGANIDALALN